MCLINIMANIILHIPKSYFYHKLYNIHILYSFFIYNQCCLGGPGSGKGTIVNNLVDMFNFRFICGEDLIIENLSQKMLPEGGSGSGICATRELQKLVAEDSSQLTLHWVLELLDKKISKYPNEVIIVDMVPNLKFLLRIPELSKECSKEMAAFEKKVEICYNFSPIFLLNNLSFIHLFTTEFI